MKIKIKLYLVINGLETKKQKIFLKETIKKRLFRLFSRWWISWKRRIDSIRWSQLKIIRPLSRNGFRGKPRGLSYIIWELILESIIRIKWG